MGAGAASDVTGGSGALLLGLLEQPVAARTLLDRIPLPLVLLSGDRRVVFMNRAASALTAMPQEKALGLPCRYVFRCSLCTEGCPLDVADRSPGGGVPFSAEVDILTAGRERVPVRVTCGALVAPDEARVGHFVTLEDMRPFRAPEPQPEWAQGFGDMLGHCAAMEQVYRLLPGIALADSSVLVTGETGTGKDLLAEAIHNASGRAKGPFVKVNCGALPESLLESELFGHRKGAFTGATEHKPGRFRLAHNGTLFLTEVGDLPLPLQVKLLTFLDDKVIHPLGATSGVHVDVRIIAATHRDLRRMAREGLFREDLLYRLNVVRLHLPPLRDREGDVALFLGHYLRVYGGLLGKRIAGFAPEVERALLSHAYPGNVRELRNIVEYCVNVCGGSRVGMEHLPRHLLEDGDMAVLPEEGRQPTGKAACSASGTGSGIASGAASGIASYFASDFGRRAQRPAPGGHDAHGVPGAAGTRTAQAGATPAQLPAGAAGETWADTERRLILEALVRARGRRTQAARELGWARTTLWRKMRQYGLEP